MEAIAATATAASLFAGLNLGGPLTSGAFVFTCLGAVIIIVMSVVGGWIVLHRRVDHVDRESKERDESISRNIEGKYNSLASDIAIQENNMGHMNASIADLLNETRAGFRLVSERFDKLNDRLLDMKADK